MKKLLKQEKKYTDNNMSVVLERVESQFKIFGEAQSLLINKVDKIETKVDKLAENTRNQFMAFGEGQEILSNKVDKIDERLENVEVKVDKIDEKVEEVDERLIRVEDDVVEIKNKLPEKVDLEDFQNLEKQSVKLEKIVLAKI